MPLRRSVSLDSASKKKLISFKSSEILSVLKAQGDGWSSNSHSLKKSVVNSNKNRNLHECVFSLISEL